MKIKSAFLLLSFVFLSMASCSIEKEKKIANHIVQENTSNIGMGTVSLAISGMTCEIGCAKTIQSKLSKKEGVAEAKVQFNERLATITFDLSKTSPEDLTSFINGIAGGDIYKASPFILTK